MTLHRAVPAPHSMADVETSAQPSVDVHASAGSMDILES